MIISTTTIIAGAGRLSPTANIRFFRALPSVYPVSAYHFLKARLVDYLNAEALGFC